MRFEFKKGKSTFVLKFLDHGTYYAESGEVLIPFNAKKFSYKEAKAFKSKRLVKLVPYDTEIAGRTRRLS